MAYLLPAFILFDTARACIAFGVIRYGVYLPPAKIAFLSETCKLTCALAFHFRWHRANTRVPNATIPSSWFSSLLPRSTSTGEVDYQICFYTAVPALLYLINNVFYLVGLRFVSPALLNTAMLAKLPLTAVLHYLIMKRARCSAAWISLSVLSTSVLSLHMPWDHIGEALWPSLASAPPAATAAATEGAGTFMVWFGPLLGFVIAAISSVTAIATEILLKKPMPFWSLQIWLYAWGALFAAFMVMAGVDRPASEAHNPEAQIDENMGYLAVVLTTCATGLVVANILRKSDNLVKLVGSSATIVTTLLLQPLLDPGLWSETCNPATVLAVGVIAMSTWTYNYYKEQPVNSSGSIELPLHSPKEKILASPDVSMESLALNTERIDVYHDEDDDDVRPSQKQASSSSDWLTPTRSKLINSSLVIVLLATMTALFAKPEDMRRRLSKYDPLAGIRFASWSEKPQDLDCVMNWQYEANITVQSGRFSEWDRRYLQQTKCPIYPIAQGGYMFHMLWLGPLPTSVSTSIALTMDAWLATQRLQDGHQLVFWFDQPPSMLIDRYTDYADFVQFRHFDPETESAGTCLSNMREFNDEAYREEVKMAAQTKSDLVRVLLLEKYGGVWLDTDSIPMRDMTPLFRMGSFSPALSKWMWNNNVLFFGPPKSAVASAVLETACGMPYDEKLFHAKYPDIKPVHWYWMYNDGLLQVCEKYTNCGVQRLPIGLFDAEVESWNRPGQTAIHAYATEADGHDLLIGQILPIAFRETFIWHARANQHPDSFNPSIGTAIRVIRHRIDDLLQMGPSYEGQDLFAGPALIE